MTRHTKEAPQQLDENGKPASHDAQRRRLLRAGVSSSLLLTIASRPAWANGGMCTPSALASANASGRHDFDGCSISAGWWKNSVHRWPIPASTPFHAKFGSVYYKDQLLYSGMTLGQVIELQGSSDPVQGSFGLHLVGALLNAISFAPQEGAPGYAFTEQQIISAFNQLNGANASSFQALANTLEAANNQYDSLTEKP
jgi:hypothetical protein